jgi:hypothetical protein
MTFSTLRASYEWAPIRDCPGRFILRGVSHHLTMDDLLGRGAQVWKFTPAAAKDTVLVARLDHGGVISYERADGTYLHTLNTEDGFNRKLQQLGIVLNHD